MVKAEREGGGRTLTPTWKKSLESLKISPVFAGLGVFKALPLPARFPTVQEVHCCHLHSTEGETEAELGPSWLVTGASPLDLVQDSSGHQGQSQERLLSPLPSLNPPPRAVRLSHSTEPAVLEATSIPVLMLRPMSFP